MGLPHGGSCWCPTFHSRPLHLHSLKHQGHHPIDGVESQVWSPELCLCLLFVCVRRIQIDLLFQRRTVPGYGKVLYCPDGIANILLLAHVAKTCLVTFNSTNGNQFEVTKDDGSTRIFKQSQQGMYYFDMQNAKSFT
jgi:hypothetical protein